MDGRQRKRFFPWLGVMLLLCGGCSAYRIESQERLIDSVSRTRHKSVLNYEDTTRKNTLYNIYTHFDLQVEIEKPYMIAAPLPPLDETEGEMLDIYRITDISGTSVFLAELDGKGTVTSYRLVLSAGLGLDEMAERLLKKLKLEPAYQASHSAKTTVFIRISLGPAVRL